MARRLPPRHRSGPKKGQFKKRGTSSRRRRRRRNPVSTTTRAATRRRAPAARRRAPARRRNPRRRGIVEQLTGGVQDAVGIVLGKAAARALPSMVGMQKAGNTGLLTQAIAALAAGMAADRFLGVRTGRLVLAGGLTAPLESFVVGAGIPWISGALQPTGMGAYVTPHAIAAAPTRVGMGSYVQPSNGLGSYVEAEAWGGFEDGGWAQQ